MKKLIYTVIFSVLLTTAGFAFASKNNFQFQVSEYTTQRQGVQKLDLFIRYAMKDNVDYAAYPDYRELRSIAMKYLEPSDDLPVNTYWEIIAEKIGDTLMERYPLSGISVQILTYPNETGSIYEPGFHGPIYTVGEVIPLTQVVMPSGLSEKHTETSQVKTKIDVKAVKLK